MNPVTPDTKIGASMAVEQQETSVWKQWADGGRREIDRENAEKILVVEIGVIAVKQVGWAREHVEDIVRLDLGCQFCRSDQI